MRHQAEPRGEVDGADLVRRRGALSDQPVAHAMQNLHVELRLALERHEPHRRPGRRLGNRLGVAIIVLLRLDIGRACSGDISRTS